MTLAETIELSSAALTPIVAVAASWLTYMSYSLSRAKRRDDLFELRYKFYKDLERWWLDTGDAAAGPRIPGAEWDDLEPAAHKAQFLFGDDIAEHIRSLEGQVHEGHPWVPDDDFQKPFDRYLKLGGPL